MFLSEPNQTAYDLHFSVGGIPVRVHPMFWLVSAVMGANSHDGVDFVIWVGVSFFSILIHELGHAVSMRKFGESPRVVLYGMGGLAISDGASMYRSGSYTRGRNPFEQILISFAGPAAGFLLAGIVIGLSQGLGGGLVFALPNWEHPIFWHILGIENDHLAYLVHALLFVNIFWGLVNLLPVYPLDGGQIARQVLISQDPSDGVRKSLWVSFMVAAAIAIFAYIKMQDTYMALMFGVLAYSSYTTLQQFGGGGRRRW